MKRDHKERGKLRLPPTTVMPKFAVVVGIYKGEIKRDQEIA